MIKNAPIITRKLLMLVDHLLNLNTTRQQTTVGRMTEPFITALHQWREIIRVPTVCCWNFRVFFIMRLFVVILLRLAGGGVCAFVSMAVDIVSVQLLDEYASQEICIYGVRQL
jgi:hypothetical protein